MPGNLSFTDLKKAVSAGTIDTVIVAMVDMQGRLVGKRFQAEFFVDGAHEETHGCNYLLADDIDMEPVPGYAAASWEQGYGDFVMKPDMTTLRRLPWLEGTALVLADVLDHHHHDVPHSPRAMLKAQVARLKKQKMRAYCASELEFYLFDESYEALHAKRYHEPKTAGYYIEDYHILQTTKEEGVMRAIRKGLQGAGIPVENSKGEWGPGQEEINVRYADALDMADNHVILKNGTKEIAHALGKAITFMSKWNYGLAGSSSHVHVSLWDAAGKTPLFYDAKAEFTMSPLMRSFVAGQLKYASDITWFLAPYINSYKRFQVGTFAPTKAVWSRDNRTAGFRLCGEGSKAIRIECRIGGADLNPYLAFAALIAAGLEGHRGEADAGAAVLGRCLSRQEAARSAEDLARGDRGSRQVEDAARGARRCGDRPLCPHREVGAVRVRPAHHRLGADARVREVLTPSSSPELDPAIHLLVTRTLLFDGCAGRSLALPEDKSACPTSSASLPSMAARWCGAPASSAAEIEAAVAAARKAQAEWKRVPVAERGKILEQSRRRDAGDARRGRAGAGLADGPAGALRRQRAWRLRGTRARHDRAWPRARSPTSFRSRRRASSATSRASRSASCSPSRRGITRISRR